MICTFCGQDHSDDRASQPTFELMMYADGMVALKGRDSAISELPDGIKTVAEVLRDVADSLEGKPSSATAIASWGKW